MISEDRVRDLLHDSRWALPAWPDAQARVRRAARRQRVTAASVGAAVAAFVTTAAVIPVVLLGRLSPGGSPGPGALPVVGSFRTPAVGAVGFAAAIYPAAVKARAARGITALCPDPAGLQAFGPGKASVPRAVLTKLAQVQAASAVQGAGPAVSRVARPGPAPGLTSKQILTISLRLSDRAFWPRLAKSGAVIVQAAQVPVIYSGPLRSYHRAHGPPGPAGVVAVSCGSRVAMDTWVIVSGLPSGPAAEAETFFLNRRGHVLLYNAATA